MADRTMIRLGTRGSLLARWQTDHIRDLLAQHWPDTTAEIEVIRTRGDAVLDTPLPLLGGKGVFTAELEAALRNREIDFAVHSLKDLPTENPAGLTIGAVTERANPHDALVSRDGHSLDSLPQDAVIGTSSRRRAAQLLHERDDLQIIDIRGNIDTRLRKALDADGPYDAILLACAGLERLERLDVVAEILPAEVMLPAPGQAALAVQCRDETESLELLEPINHRETEIAVTAERAFLAGLGGGCSLPIAAYAIVEGDFVHLRGRISAPDGSQQIDVDAEGEGSVESARQLGDDLAREALAQGAQAILERIG